MRNLYRGGAALIAAVALGLAGCSQGGGTGEEATESESPESAASEQLHFAFSFGQSQHPFFIAMEQGARDAADEAGVNLTTTSADFKAETQVNNIENELQTGIDALLVNPIDSEALAPTVQQALDQDVPVFAVDIDVVGAEVTSFISSNNEEIGRTAARTIAEALDGKGKIAILGWPTITSTRDRQTGFEEEIKSFPDIEVVATSGAGAERATSMDAAENILQSNPDLDAVFGVNEAAALGTLSAAEGQGRSDVLIVGVDATPDLLEAIKDGTQVKYAIAQDPYMMGKRAVELAVKVCNGEEVEKFVAIDTDVVTSENVDTFIEREAAYLE